MYTMKSLISIVAGLRMTFLYNLVVLVYKFSIIKACFKPVAGNASDTIALQFLYSIP